jgi:hypothetical protein
VIARARAATVHRAAAERYVGELDRWARPAPQPRRWVAWLTTGGAAVVAAVVVALWIAGRAPSETLTPVRIGDRVAIIAAPASVYRVVRADPGATEIAIDRGTVTARLWRTDRPHRLTLAGGGITATAKGTIYSLGVEPAGPIVHVSEGTVEVRAGEGLHVVHAGASWPVTATAPDPVAGRALLALALTTSLPSLVADADADTDAGVAIDAAAPVASPSDAGVDTPRTPAPAMPPDAPAIKDRWRTARLLRGQGRFTAALTECLAIADARDPMWSPIALVEAIRIEIAPLAAPERSIALADRMIREWPDDPLVAEARELRCRALRQLGRASECTPVP